MERFPKEAGLEESEMGGRIETIQITALQIGQNTEKSPGDLRRLAVTHTPEKEYEQTLV